MNPVRYADGVLPSLEERKSSAVQRMCSILHLALALDFPSKAYSEGGFGR